MEFNNTLNIDEIWRLLDDVNELTGINDKIKTLNLESLLFNNCMNYNDLTCECSVYGDVNICDISCIYFSDRDDVYEEEC